MKGSEKDTENSCDVEERDEAFSTDTEFMFSSSGATRHLNYLFEMTDPELACSFRQFLLDQESPLFPMVLSVSMLVCWSFFISLATWHDSDSEIVTSVMCCVFSFFVIVFGFVIVYLHYRISDCKRHNKEKTRSVILQTLRKNLLLVNYLYLFSLQSFVLFFAIRRAITRLCVSFADEGNKDALQMFFCGQVDELHLSYDAVGLLIFAPPIMAKVLPSLSVRCNWLQMISSMSTFAVIAAVKRQMPSIFFLVLWVISNVFLVANMQVTKFKSFYFYQRLKELMRKNEKNAEEFHVSEMRHLIGNVAHDLKTPLMSFTSAIDLIAQHTKDLSTLPAELPCSTVLRTHMESVQHCVQSLQDTNAFMLMTINRCVDYAKAAKGVALTPTLQTISLQDVIHAPLLCVRNVQDRVPIEVDLSQCDALLCTHVVTDRQWLHDNLLCLLSNAAKYTVTHGKVALRVSLVDELALQSVSHSAIAVVATAAAGKTHEGTVCTSPSSSVREESQRAPFVPCISPSPSPSHCISSFPPPPSPCHSSFPCVPSDPSSSPCPCPPQFLLFEVEDEGVGVAPELAALLFQPFQQRARCSVGGTGLGLFALAKRVSALRGACGMRERDGGLRGSVFWFAVPYCPDTVAAMQAREKEGEGEEMEEKATVEKEKNEDQNESCVSCMDNIQHTTRSDNTNPPHHTDSVSPSPSLSHKRTGQREGEGDALRVLVVDDSPSIVKLTAMTLRKLGHAIATAEDGAVAVRRVEELWTQRGECFDVILMDLQMPVMDGLQATRRIRELQEYVILSEDCESSLCTTSSSLALPRQRIVCVSANADPETERSALDVGADAFLAKPFTTEMFTRVVRNLV